MKVAPLVGAWIESFLEFFNFIENPGRSSCRSVD